MMHATDDELLQAIYGVNENGAHVAACSECQSRLNVMRQRRHEADNAVEFVSGDFLHAQRRAIYSRIDTESRRPWYAVQHGRAWATAALAIALLTGGASLIHHETNPPRISDAQLVQQASEIANDAEPKAAAPLQALFDNGDSDSGGAM